MHHVLFLHDTALSLKRGAELTITQLISKGNELGFSVSEDLLEDFELTKTKILKADLVIVNSTSRCQYEMALIQFLLDENINYIKVEYDYNFCVRRNVLCVLDKSIRNCCNVDKFHIYRTLFAKAKCNIFQSPSHYNYHYDFYGEAVANHVIACPTIDVDNLQISKTKSDVIPFFGDLNYLKGGNALIDYAQEHPNRPFVVYGKNQLRRPIPKNVTFKPYIENNEVLKLLGKTKDIIIKPVWPEPSGRLAAEAFLSGCNLITNDRVGTWSFDFYPNNKVKAVQDIKNTIPDLWHIFQEHLASSKVTSSTENLGKVLVKKNYGGLGDIFFTIPAVYKLKPISKSVTYALQPRLVNFFQTHLNDVAVVSETDIDEADYDQVIELGNYPKFSEAKNHVSYITSKKVKQHAIQHYIDAISRFHIAISNTNKGYPYFKKQTNYKKPYYTVHPGAGFLLKAWPIDYFASLIEKIDAYYPELSVKVIKGPNDPDIIPFLKHKEVTIIDGDIDAVGEAISGALFHIGNDAGITHLAGAFNTPILTVYGPTGPGSWGAFSEHVELIWGKKGNCNLRCNYDVIINCKDRVCLNKVSHNIMFYRLLKLFSQMAYTITNQFYFNANFTIEQNTNSFIFKSREQEYLIEFTDNESLQFFTTQFEGYSIDVTEMPAQFGEVFKALVELDIFTSIPKINLPN